MENRIEELSETILLGRSMRMSLAHDATRELWQGSMPLLKSIQTERLDTNYISMQVYDTPLDLKTFNPEMTFTKWAGVSVKHLSTEIPGLSSYSIRGGLYAVFKHKGPASEFARSMQFIYSDWLPKSNYTLDHREHFELIPEGYGPDDPEAEEEIWIPIKKNDK